MFLSQNVFVNITDTGEYKEGKVGQKSHNLKMVAISEAKSHHHSIPPFPNPGPIPNPDLE